ncbi:MAG: hypothetical protein FWE59_02885, partial [Oscillospiraceae bacterium]|nr:hypothetical protein [Oscillospiraceae bacterium]
YFETMWEGWHRYGDPELTTSHHPILQRDYEWLERIDEDSYIVENDTKRVVFKLDILDELLTSDLAGWRALPMPRLTDAVQRNYFGCLYAVVNPYGKNKELAIEFLEAAAANMISNVNRPVFVIEDISAYEGYYDMSLPIYRDIHNIYRDGATLRDLFSMRESEQIIDDYQDGTVTLQQAVDEIQRKAEFWLNE